MKTEDQAIAHKAAEIAMKETEKLLKRAGLTKSRVLKRIKEGLDAHDVKATYDKDSEKWVYSKGLIAHGTRLKAAEMAVVLLDMKPAEKKEIRGSLTLNHELSPDVQTMFDKIYEKGKP